MPKNQKIKFGKYFTTLAALLIASAFFVFWPGNAQAALDIPTTACGNIHHDLIVNNFSVHLTTTSEPEPGSRAFTYGAGNNSFASRNGNIVTFNAVPIFTPSNTATIKAYALNEDCGVVFGFGPQFGGNLTQGDNLFSIDLENNQFGSLTAFFKDETQFFFYSSVPRYIWIEVWDGVNGSEFASYSYLVDVENIQNPSGQVGEEPARNPVLIVPGILGTELYNGDDLIWADLSQLFTDVNDQFLTENLSLDANGNSLNDISKGNIIEEIKVPFSVFGLDIFKSLIEELKSQGYQDNTSLFYAPYDWRLDLDITAQQLQNEILATKTKTGAQKIDIVAHSMGGLVVKNYINEYGKNSINKLIFIGVPHLGAPKSAKVLLYGDRFSIPWLEEDRMKELSINSPSVYQLLPGQAYFNNFEGYKAPFQLFTNNLLDYHATQEFLLSKGLNGALLDRAIEFSNKNLEDLDLGNLEVYNIAGCAISTQAAYRQSIFGNLGSIGYTSGDETVPLVSADFINIPSENKYYIKKGEHGELPSTGGVRELIYGILSDNIILENDVSTDKDFCKFKGKKLSWHSPVEVHIYDSLGNHTGPLENNIIENSIPGVGYDIIEGEKFVYLPTDEGQEYTVVAKGLEQGTFDLLISEDDNGTTGKTYVFDNVEITASTQVKFNVSENSKDNLFQIDVQGNNIFVPYNADLELLNDEQINDTTPPEFLINFSLEEEQIIFTAKDNTDPDPTIFCTNTSCITEDWAGNKTTLNFVYRNLGSQHALGLESIAYNNEAHKAIEANFVVHHIESRGKLRGFAQTFYKEHNTFTRINYNERKDESTITAHGKGITRKVEQGIKLLQIETEQGTINLIIN